MAKNLSLHDLLIAYINQTNKALFVEYDKLSNDQKEAYARRLYYLTSLYEDLQRRNKF